jgi:thiol-disulfide isomerase/thioredoxin
MKKYLIGLLVILITGCSTVSTMSNKSDPTNTERGAIPPVVRPTNTTNPNLPDLGKAPELENTVWLNANHPLRLADLHGSVVLLDMWTFDCINCQHVIPYLENWYNQYHSKGLVIIGNHYPEFGYEADLNNLKQAVERLKITYPVAQDNDGSTWDAYHNQYWPALYLIDKRGEIRYRYIGEGNYAETERAIQSLLADVYP